MFDWIKEILRNIRIKIKELNFKGKRYNSVTLFLKYIIKYNISIFMEQENIWKFKWLYKWNW